MAQLNVADNSDDNDSNENEDDKDLTDAKYDIDDKYRLTCTQDVFWTACARITQK